MKTSLNPVSTSERIHILDILRGFAVFGILVVNIIGLASPAYLPGYPNSPEPPFYDRLAEMFILYAADGKFFTIFSFLFGLGFSVQLSRAQAKGRDIGSYYPRRLLVLFAFGILHSFFWYDDILRLYALLGFTLLWFRHRTNREVLAWIFGFFVLGYLASLLHAPLKEVMPNLYANGNEIFRSGFLWQVFQFQAGIQFYMLIYVFQIQAANVMYLFLLGMLAGRLKFFENIEAHRETLKKIAIVALLINFVFDILFFFSKTDWLSNLEFSIGAPALSAAYVSLLCLFWTHPLGAKWLAPLAAAGRMALTNYILQSVICSFIFNGYGLGLYGKVGAAGLLGFSVAIYAIQVALSNWWLARFQFGPLEWAWRSLTYLKKQPFRRQEI